MITRLNNFTFKSFVNYTNPEDLLFRNKNILFGYNGKGKSSIAFGIKDELLKTASAKFENLRIFDRDFILNSLLLDSSDGKIKGVEAIFGKEGVDIEKKINKLEKLIIDEGGIRNIDEDIVKLRKEVRTEIDKIHDRRKSDSNIQKKSKDGTVERVIELYRKDLDSAKKIESDENTLRKINGDDSIEKQIVQKENLRPLVFNKIPDNIIEDVKVLFAEKFGNDISIPEYEVVQWIKSGWLLHKEGDDCKFCSGKLDLSDVERKMIQYKENKRHKATEKLNQFKDHLERLLDDIRIIEKETKMYSTDIGSKVEKHFDAIVANESRVEFLITSCQSKIDSLKTPLNFDFNLLTVTLKAIEESVLTIDKYKKDQLSDLRTKQYNLTTLVKGAIGLEIVESITINNKLRELTIKNNELREKLESNENKNREIQELRQQKSLTKGFADFVSQILKDINISLKITLDIDNRNYIIKSADEIATLTIEDISEGEKNLLGLLFFYYELFDDNKQLQVKPDIDIIVVDDPISSMDDSNKFYILELMKNLLELKNQQVFIMTHSWEDFCNLTYGRKAWEDKIDNGSKIDKSKYATFEVKKTPGNSILAKIANVEKPYKYLFKEIYEFSLKSEEDLKLECHIYHYPNVMRRLFEAWYGFKIGRDLNFTSSIQKRIESDLKITTNVDKTKFGLLIKVCNILSHSINGSMSSSEILSSAKYLMTLIEKNDSLHYNNMKK